MKTSPKCSVKKLNIKKSSEKKEDGNEVRETLEFPKFSLIMKSKCENKTFGDIEE
jgi:ribosomal protein L9